MQPTYLQPQAFTPEPGLNKAVMFFLVLYTICHILFLPMEVVVISVFNDPAVLVLFFGSILAFCVKYYIMYQLYAVLLNKEKYDASALIRRAIFNVLSVTGGAGLVYILADTLQQKNIGNLLHTPYIIDFTGFVFCTVMGTIYFCYLISIMRQRQGYTMMMKPYRLKNAYFIPISLTN